MRSHVPWPWLLLPVALLGLTVWLIVQKNETGVLGQEVESLRQKIQAQSEELIFLRSTAGTGQNAVNIERAAQQQLLGRIHSLETENAVLKEDILLFERLIPVAGERASVRVENFRVAKESGSRFRYRLLISFWSDKKAPDFRGRFQLAISYVSAGKVFQLILPDRQESAIEYQFEIKSILRREGVFELPAGAVLQGAEVRVLQGDTLKSKRLAQL